MQTLFYKHKSSALAPEIMAVLLILQPLLDILSFWSGAGDLLVFRAILLFGASALGFLMARNKLPYLLLYAALSIFWILHILSCLRSGYQNPLSDFAGYLNLIQFPIWTFSFITFFQQIKGLSSAIFGVLAANFSLILLTIFLSILTRTASYAQSEPPIGLVGWFSSAHTQSIILAILSIAVLFWALNQDSLLIFSFTLLVTVGILHVLGTKSAFYYSIFIAVVFIAVILLQHFHYLYIAPLVLAVLLLVSLKAFSPMEKIQNLEEERVSSYQQKTDASLGSNIDAARERPKKMSAETKLQIQNLYETVYSDSSLLGDLLAEFGTEKVAEAYDYSIDAKKLSDIHVKKEISIKLARSEKDFLTKLLGFEIVSTEKETQISHARNDWTELFSRYGYLGGLGFTVFFFYFFWLACKHILWTFPQLPSSPFLISIMSITLLFFTALLSGDVFLNPSISVYLALFAAVIYYQTVLYPSHHQNNSKYTKKPVVTIKRL